MKTCTKCGVEQNESDFAFREHRKLRTTCKACDRKRAAINRTRPGVKEMLKAAQVRFRNTEHGRQKIRENCRKFRQTDNFKKAIEKYRANNPEKRVAGIAVMNALKLKKLTRPESCSVCHKPCRPEGHHFDYSKPLEVVWVCKACHTEFHWGNCL